MTPNMTKVSPPITMCSDLSEGLYVIDTAGFYFNVKGSKNQKDIKLLLICQRQINTTAHTDFNSDCRYSK